MPRVSIVIVNYNGERYINNLFRSLLNQTFKDFEIVFTDNASTDSSLHLVRKYEKNLVIKIRENKQNVGFCIANNEALQLCRGEYVVFLNNDTYVEPKWLEILVERAEISSTVGAVACSIMHPLSREMQEGPTEYDIYGAAIGPAIGEFFYGTGACLLIKRALLQEIGAFDSKLFMYQDDTDICWRIRLCGYDIAFEPKAICFHLKRSIGLWADNIRMPTWVFYHAHCKNRIRVLAKNYSRVHVIGRIPKALALVFARSLLLSLINRKPQYLLYYAKGLAWNLYNLKDTLKERQKVQRLRTKTDNEIIKHMLPYSIELRTIGELFRQTRKFTLSL